jgi:dihydrofolate reductase
VFCIGGGELFRESLARSEVVHLTRIERDFAGDTTFPSLDPAQWREVQREAHRQPGADGLEYAFITYHRVH